MQAFAEHLKSFADVVMPMSLGMSAGSMDLRRALDAGNVQYVGPPTEAAELAANKLRYIPAIPST